VEALAALSRLPATPPDSWASDPANSIAIWSAKLDPGARLDLPPAIGGSAINRVLYYFSGGGSEGLDVSGRVLSGFSMVQLDGGAPASVSNLSPDDPAEVLILQVNPRAFCCECCFPKARELSQSALPFRVAPSGSLWRNTDLLL
jgi:hypothetical protein